LLVFSFSIIIILVFYGESEHCFLVLMSWAGMAFTLDLFKFWCHEKESIDPASNNLKAIFVRNDGL